MGDGIYINDGRTKTNKKSINAKIAKNCKWSYSDVMGITDYKKSSYFAIKKHIDSVRKDFVKDGEYSSPGGIYIHIKNNKVVRVNILYS